MSGDTSGQPRSEAAQTTARTQVDVLTTNREVPAVEIDGLGAPFACNWTSTRGAAWATLTGELDIAQAPMLEHALRTAEVDAHLVVLDLRELSFIDCTGLRVIYESSERLRQAGHRLIVVRGPRPVDMVFTHTGIAERIEVVDLQPAEPAIRVLEIVGAQPGT